MHIRSQGLEMYSVRHQTAQVYVLVCKCEQHEMWKKITLDSIYPEITVTQVKFKSIFTKSLLFCLFDGFIKCSRFMQYTETILLLDLNLNASHLSILLHTFLDWKYVT